MICFQILLAVHPDLFLFPCDHLTHLDHLDPHHRLEHPDLVLLPAEAVPGLLLNFQGKASVSTKVKVGNLRWTLLSFCFHFIQFYLRGFLIDWTLLLDRICGRLHNVILIFRQKINCFLQIICLTFLGLLPMDWLCSAPISENFHTFFTRNTFIHGRRDWMGWRRGWWESEFWVLAQNSYETVETVIFCTIFESHAPIAKFE